MPKKEPSFEADLTRLEEMADRMEQGNLELDELMKLYEQGTELSKALHQRLEGAKARLTEVMGKADGSTETSLVQMVEQGSLLDGLDD